MWFFIYVYDLFLCCCGENERQAPEDIDDPDEGEEEDPVSPPPTLSRSFVRRDEQDRLSEGATHDSPLHPESYTCRCCGSDY